MGYSMRYDTYYDSQTGEWLEKIGFCPPEENCIYCQTYERDGRPQTAFEAPKDAIESEPKKQEE